MYHSHDFDLDLCNEVIAVTVESPPPRWFPIVIAAVGSLYGLAGFAAFALLT